MLNKNRSRANFWLLLVLSLSSILPAMKAQGGDCALEPEPEGAGAGTAWTNGVVPYRFDAGVTLSEQANIFRCMAELEGACGVTFIPRTNQANYITVRENPNSSTVSTSSNVGMAGGEQFISIGSSLWSVTFHLCHEFSHALGFRHEHQRPDRDLFVTIQAANISQTACNGNPCNGNFTLDPAATALGPYDYVSYMHYNDTSFSTNGQPTIITINPAFQNVIGQRDYMSMGDAAMLQARYGAAPTPTVSSMVPFQALIGSGPTVVTLNGTKFYNGSPNASGVQGTRVRWNGQILTTTWISATQVQFTIPANLLTTAGCHTVQVENPAPNGGLSSALQFNVIDLTPVPGVYPGFLADEAKGYAVAGLGDVNGDGRDDVLVGSPDYVGGNGQVVCYAGGTGAILWSVQGPSDAAYGYALATIPDRNGDGISDVMVGAPGYSNDRGRIQVLSGASGAVIQTYNGANAGDRFGAAVDHAGDVNQDGTADLLVGAPGFNSSTGIAYVFHGVTGALLYNFGGGANGDQQGYAVAGGTDYNSDGVPDVVVGAPFTGATNAGQIRVYFSPNYNLFYSANGANSYDNLGSSIDTVSYLPVTGGAAIVAGAPQPGAGFVAAPGNGEVRIYRIGISNLQLVATLLGDAAGDRFGACVRVAGDLDQDGTVELAIGATELGSLFSIPGEGYVAFYDGDGLTEMGRRDGVASGDRFGFAIAEAGDGDADGRPDVVIGAPESDFLCPGSGVATSVSLIIRPEFQKVMITEITSGAPDAVEITNFATTTTSLSGWRLFWKDGANTHEAVLSGNLAPGQSLVVRDAAGVFPETPPGVTTLVAFPSIGTQSGDFVVTLTGRGRAVVDEVRVASTAGTYVEGTLGGHFCGLATRPSAMLNGSLERFWGLDSNSGGDWTEQPTTSMGLENRSSGARGTDPRPLPVVLISEVDDSPDYIELRNIGATRDLEGYTLLASGSQNQSVVTLRPFPGPRTIGTNGYVVIGDGATAPAEMPFFIPYVNLSGIGGGNIPFTTLEGALALYDSYGRQIDEVRMLATTGPVVHNHPRLPGPTLSFAGGAPRTTFGDVSLGRVSYLSDTDTGGDFRAISGRSMGLANPPGNFVGSAGTGLPTARLDARVHETAAGEGLTLILNGGPDRAFDTWNLTVSGGHLNGTGPVLGLGVDAIANFIQLSATPPWFGTLDANGSARLDVPAGSLPVGIDFDVLFLIFNPQGGLVLYSPVIEYDT